MGREHQRVVRQLREAPKRPELGAGEGIGVLRTQEIRPGRRTDDQGSAGEHGPWLIAVHQQVRHVLVGVARGGPPTKRQPAQVDLSAVHQSEVVEASVSVRGADHPGAVATGKADRTRQEVGVQVRLRGERDGQSVRRRGGVDRPQVERGVHGQSPPITQIHQISLVP